MKYYHYFVQLANQIDYYFMTYYYQLNYELKIIILKYYHSFKVFIILVMKLIKLLIHSLIVLNTFYEKILT